MTDPHGTEESPLLSILIPAYNHPDGVELALSSLGPLASTPAVEVIVSDDSTQEDCIARIKAMTASLSSARYSCNLSPKGAVQNWNFLLDEAKGRYCLLLHHDEYMHNNLVLGRVLSILSKEPSIDAIVLPCRTKEGMQPLRLHMPAWITEFITRRWPSYLLRRNLFGPPSVLILRRSLYEHYDPRLQWLVDVELYYRVLSRRFLNIVFLRGPGISSRPLITSITSKLRSDIKTVEKEEQELLTRKCSAMSLWYGSSGIKTKSLRALETIAWYGLRSAQHSIHLLRWIVHKIFVLKRPRNGG